MKRIELELKNIIILGSSGFIGSSIKEYIKKKKINIKRIFTYSRKEKKNILNVKKLPKVDYIIYCINSKKISETIKIFNHFRKLLYRCPKSTKILFLSSGAVYGKSKINKRPTEMAKIDIKLINKFIGYKKNYAKEKVYLEKKFLELSNEGYRVSIARCFTFVGKKIPKRANFLIGNLINNILEKKKLFVKSNYEIIRSYMHTDDLSRCLFTIMNKTGKKCKIYNVGSDDVLNVKLLLKKLSRKYKIKSRQVNILDKKKADFYVPNIEKLKKELKWKTKYKSFEAIEKTIYDLKNNK